MGNINILLNGTRQSPDMPLSNTVNLGSKFLAVITGGQVSLYGLPVGQRWMKLGGNYTAGSSRLVLSSPHHGWAVNQTIVVTSSSYNSNQFEYATITNISSDNLTLTISPPLSFNHSGAFKAYPNAPDVVDLRVEVGIGARGLRMCSGRAGHAMPVPLPATRTCATCTARYCRWPCSPATSALRRLTGPPRWRREARPLARGSSLTAAPWANSTTHSSSKLPAWPGLFSHIPSSQ